MRIGIPKEIKSLEKRVALAPQGVDSLVRSGHTVYVQSGAGEGSQFSDEKYKELGAKIVYNVDEIYQRSEMIVMISKPTEEIVDRLQENQVVFSFMHLAVGKKKVFTKLLDKKITAIGLELIEDNVSLPVLQTMSEIAGQLAVQVAESLLVSTSPVGRGILLGGITGVAPAAVVILGAGMVGTIAARTALGRGAQVIVLDKDLHKLRFIDNLLQKKVTTVVANPYTISRGVKFADVLIGAVLIKGEKTPHIVTEEMVKSMKAGAVIVDVSIDQGGCIETSRPTSLADPYYISHDVIHYCVPNMTSMVSRTASYAITNSAIPYIHAIADKGLNSALMDDTGLCKGVCTYNGYCSNESLAATFNSEYRRIHIFSKN